MMQSQGLGALMPQGAQQMAPPQQQQPPMDPQRLAAATNLVSSDAERQVLDPRTLALIKYKDAVAAMQAADELMAASQPTPTPPTVAERVQQSAQEGIMGLASRLGAGIQQQGSNMQAQQMQQAMAGGLPQLPAPNMAGMAQGGIVGYQEGGDVESAELEQLTQQLVQEGVPPEEARNEARLRLRLPLPGLPRVPNLLPDPTAPARAAARVAGSAYDSLPDAFGGGRGEDFGRQASAPGAVDALIPSSTYGMGDRTGSIQLPDNLLGGAGNILRSLLPSASTDSSQPIQGSMSDEEIADFTQRRQPAPSAEVETILSGQEPSPESARRGAYTGPTSAERRARTAERTEGSLQRMVEQAKQRAEQAEQRAARRRAETELRQNLARDGLGRAEIDQIIAAQRLPEEELESAEVSSGLPGVLSAITQDAAQPRFLPEQSQPSAPDRGPVRRMPENELGQIAAEIESDPNAFERLASWVVENPYDAISMGLIAVPGIGLAGSLSMRIGGALMRSPAVRRAIQSLYTRPNPAVTRGPGFTMRDPNMPLRVGAPGRAISAGSGVVGTGMMLGRGGDGEGIASLPIGSTGETTRAEAPVTPAAPAVDEAAAQAAAQAAAPAGVSQDAVEMLLEQEQQPRAGESAADRDARMRRLIAGLRGFGAQGLGGFAAGSSAEELRQEQALIAEQERAQDVAARERGFSLEEQNINLQNQFRQDQLAAQQRADAEMLQYRYDQLNQQQRAQVDAAVNAETATIRQMIQGLDARIPSLKDGLIKRDLSNAIAERASLMQQLLDAQARIIEMYDGRQYGPAQTGSAGLAPEDDALVSEYLNR